MSYFVDWSFLLASIPWPVVVGILTSRILAIAIVPFTAVNILFAWQSTVAYQVSIWPSIKAALNKHRFAISTTLYKT